jgi:hypothetical protein
MQRRAIPVGIVLGLCLAGSALAALNPLDNRLTVGPTYLAWNAGTSALGYDVVRGDLGALRDTGGDFTAAVRGCLANDFTRRFIEAPDSPGVGETWWYLERVSEPLLDSTYESGGPGQVGSRDAEINASPLSCPPPLPLHSTVLIDGNAGFTPANGLTRGRGTESDPFILEGFQVFAPTHDVVAIEIRNTDAWFVLRHVKGKSGRAGLRLSNVRHGRLEQVEAAFNTAAGIEIRSSQDLAIVDSILHDNSDGAGLYVAGSTGVTVRRNDFAHNLAGVVLEGVIMSTVVHNNVLWNDLQSLDTGGVGNSWDDDYLGGGNYWWSYAGPDRCSGPLQDRCPEPDGLGDVPYLFGDGAADRYPLIRLPGSIFDATAPTITITSPANGSQTAEASITVTGNAGDASTGVGRVEARLNQGAWSPVPVAFFQWSAPMTLSPGENLIEARAFDFAGNVSTVAAARVTLGPVTVQGPVSVRTDKLAYRLGEPVQITVTITNTTASALTLRFDSSCQAFFTVEDGSGAIVYQYERHVGCPAVLTELTLQPGESQSYPFTWIQVDDGGAPIPPGDYVIRSVIPSTPALTDGSTEVPIGLPIVATVETDKDQYLRGETVRIVVTVINTGTGPVTLNYGGCTAFFNVESAAASIVYQEKRHRICTLLATSWTSQPGEFRVYPFSWRQVDDSGAPVPGGRYVVRSEIPSDPPVHEGSAVISILP